MKRPLLKMPAQSVLTLALREGREAILFAALFSMVINGLFFALPIYTNQVYGRVLTSQSMPTLIVLTLGTLFAFSISSVVEVYKLKILSNFAAIFDQRVSGHVFSALFEGVVRRDPSAGAQALRDLDTFRQAVTGTPLLVLFDLPWIFLYLGALFVIDPVVGVVTLIGGLILLVLAYIQDRATRPALLEANTSALKSYSFTEAGLRNGEVVRAMGMLSHIGRQWGAHRVDSMRHTVIANRSANFWGNAIKFVRMVIQVLIIAAGAYLIINGKIGAGMLFANMILSSRALAPIERAVGAWPILVTAGQSFERLNTLLLEYEPASTGTILPRPKGNLTVEGVNFSAPDSARLLLTGLSFALPGGEFLGIIGPSGAGKSTLTRLLVGVWKPLNGAVRLDGADVFSWSRPDFGKHTGYLPQDIELFAGSVRDNIARFLPDVSDEEVIAAAQAAGVHDMVVRLPKGYDTELGAGGMVLSAGQRQRIGLARALFRDPAYVVLDEPNSNLDAQGEAALLAALQGMKARGATIVVVSHKPSMLQSADRLLVLREGRVDLYGPREAVMNKLAANAAAASPPSRSIEAKS
jgi:ATP-binding cassette subfamily C exporter for protease/lipase